MFSERSRQFLSKLRKNVLIVTFVQRYVVVNDVLKTLAQKHLHFRGTVSETLVGCSSNVLFFSEHSNLTLT